MSFRKDGRRAVKVRDQYTTCDPWYLVGRLLKRDPLWSRRASVEATQFTLRPSAARKPTCGASPRRTKPVHPTRANCEGATQHFHAHTGVFIHRGWGGAASGRRCECAIRGGSRQKRIEDSPQLRSLCYAVHSGLQGQLSACRT